MDPLTVRGSLEYDGSKSPEVNMDLDQIKLILRNMELLLDTLKAEVYNAESKTSVKESSPPPIMDYDEIFEDSEFYD